MYCTFGDPSAQHGRRDVLQAPISCEAPRPKTAVIGKAVSDQLSTDLDGVRLLERLTFHTGSWLGAHGLE